MGDDLFGRAELPAVVDDFDQVHHYDEEPVNEEDEEKRRLEERATKKEAFVKRYLLEKQWYREEQIRLEEQRRKEEEMMKKRMQQFTIADQKSILEKYEIEDKADEFFNPITQYKGPTNDRQTTNKKCILLWIFLNTFFFGTAIYVFLDGQPVRLVNGYDFRTEICGHGKYAEKPYLYYANPVLDIRVAFCVKECPIASGPLTCLYDTTGTYYESIYEKFCYVQMQGSLRSKYCRPNEPKNREVVDAHLESFDFSTKRYASDLFMSVEAMAVGAVVTIGLSFLFSNLIKKDNTVRCFVLSIFFIVTLCFQILAYMFYREYTQEITKNCFTLRDEKECVGSRGYTYRTFAIVMLVFGIVYLVVLTILSKRIYKIIGFLKIASQVVQILQQIKLLPFYILALAISVAVVSLITIPYGLSVADVVIKKSVDGAISGGRLKVMEFSGFAYFIAMYDFYLFLVWMIFLLGFRDIFTSYCLSIWFFTKKKETVNIPKWAIFKNIARYHVGTIVMYSIISTVITLPKMLIKVLRKTLRALPQYMNSVRYFQATCNMCLFSYEKFLRYFSKHALVQVSITSKEFYPCSKIAYFLLFRNSEKVSDIDRMQEFVINNVKFCCAFVCGLITYIFLSFIPTTPLLGYNTDEIENKIIPGIAMFIFAYFFSSIFQGSYDITCKTVIQCYLIDEEIFYGENRYVEPFIKNVFEFYVKEDLDKYKFSSKDGVQYDQEKAEKAKADNSDDDKSYQSEESDKSLEAEEIAKQKEKEDKIAAAAAAALKPTQTTTSFKPNETTTSLKLNPPSQVAPPRLPSQYPAAVKEQELVNLNVSEEEDDEEDIQVKPQPLVSEKVMPSPKVTPMPPPRYPTKKIGMTDYPAPAPKNNNTSFFSTTSNNNKPQTPIIYKPPTPVASYARPTQSSQQRAPVRLQGNSNNSPLSSSQTKFSLDSPQGNTQTKFRDQTATANTKTSQYKQPSRPVLYGQDDDDDDQPDDFGFADNPFEAGPFQNKTQPQRSTQNISLNKPTQNRNEMRLLNYSYNSQQPRGLTGQSNASNLKQSKANFDPFTQFEKNQINLDSDGEEEDDD